MKECRLLTPGELTDLITAGYIIRSGPHASEAACLIVCDGGSGSGSESGSGSGSSSGPCTCTLSELAGAASGCSECPALSVNLSLAIAGIANGTCNDCANLNGTFPLTWAGTCIWLSEPFTVCGESVQWEAIYSAGAWTVQLQGGSGPSVVFEANAPCELPVSLPKTFNSNVCVCGSVSSNECGCPDGQSPPATSFHLEVSLSDGSGNCSSANGAFVLNPTASPCIWQTTPFEFPVGSGHFAHYLVFLTAGQWKLWLTSDFYGLVAEWDGPPMADCTLPVLLTYIPGVNSLCGTGGATLTP